MASHESARETYPLPLTLTQISAMEAATQAAAVFYLGFFFFFSGIITLSIATIYLTISVIPAVTEVARSGREDARRVSIDNSVSFLFATNYFLFGDMLKASIYYYTV